MRGFVLPALGGVAAMQIIELLLQSVSGSLDQSFNLRFSVRCLWRVGHAWPINSINKDVPCRELIYRIETRHFLETQDRPVHCPERAPDYEGGEQQENSSHRP